MRKNCYFAKKDVICSGGPICTYYRDLPLKDRPDCKGCRRFISKENADNLIRQAVESLDKIDNNVSRSLTFVNYGNDSQTRDR